MPHYVKPTINGDDIRLEFTCTEPPGADCKIQCPVDPKDPYGCETFALERDKDGNPWHIGYRYDEETDEETDGYLHQMLPIENCIILEWDDLGENYAGEPGVLHAGEVKFTWQEDYYEWAYVEPPKHHEISTVLSDLDASDMSILALHRERMREEMARQVEAWKNPRWTLRLEVEEG